jgi:hypothetical protein
MAEENTQSGQVASRTAEAIERTDVDAAEKKGWLKGGLAMTICCAAPLLVFGAVTLLGISLGALASGFLSIAAVLACPVGMYLMMRMMMKNKK